MFNVSNKEHDIKFRVDEILLTNNTKISKPEDIFKKLKEYKEKKDKNDYIVSFDFEFKTLHTKQQLYLDFKQFYNFNIFNNENGIISFIHSVALILYNTKTFETDILHIYLPYFTNEELLGFFEEFKTLNQSGGMNNIASNIIQEKKNDKFQSLPKSSEKTLSKSSKSSLKNLPKTTLNTNDYFLNLKDYLEQLSQLHSKGKGKGKGKGVKEIKLNNINNNDQMIEFDTQFYFYITFKQYFKRPYMTQMTRKEIEKAINDFNKNVAISKEKIRELYELLHSIFTGYELLNKGLKDFIVFYNCFYFFTKKKLTLSYPSNYVNNYILLDRENQIKINRTNINSIYRDYDFNTGYKFKRFTDYWNKNNNDYYERFQTLETIYNYYVYEKENLEKLLDKLSKLKVKTNTKDAITIDFIIDKIKKNNLPEHIALDDTIRTFCIYLIKKK